MNHLQPVYHFQNKNKSPRSTHGEQIKEADSSSSQNDRVRERTRTSGNIVEVRGIAMKQRQKFSKCDQQYKHIKRDINCKQLGKNTLNIIGDSHPSFLNKVGIKKDSEKNQDIANNPMMVNSSNVYMDYRNYKKQDPLQNRNYRQNYKQKYDHPYINTNEKFTQKQKIQSQDDISKFIPKHIRDKKTFNLHDTNNIHNNSHQDYQNINFSNNNDQENNYDRHNIKKDQSKQRKNYNGNQQQHQLKQHKYHADFNYNKNSNNNHLMNNNNYYPSSIHKHDYIDSKNHKYSSQHDHSSHLTSNLKKNYETDINVNNIHQYDHYKSKLEKYQKEKDKQKQKGKYPPKAPSFLDSQNSKSDRFSNKEGQKKYQLSQKSDRGQKKSQKSQKQRKESSGSYTTSRSYDKINKMSFNHKKRKHQGNHIENFQIIKRLGKGSYGNVFLARQIQTTALFALKIMSKAKIKDCQNQQNIFRELKIHLYLDHRNLVQLYGVFDDSQYIYLIMEYQNEGSLFDMIKQKVTYSQKKTAKIAKQVIDALIYMHQQKIIHRDLKLQNIMSCNSVLKIGDFGCAVHTFDLRQTKIGSLAYHSPQQLMQGQYDQKVDIWSLGIIVYELLYGQTPFDEDIVNIVRNVPKAKLSDLRFPQNVPISNEAKDFIIKLLQKKPDKRINIRQASNHPFITNNTKESQNEYFF